MPFNFLQYQQLAWSPPPPTVDPSINPSEYYPPFSDPVGTIFGKKIAGIAIALMASGPFLPPQSFEQPTVDKYLIALSEPVRLDLRINLLTAAQQFTAFQLTESQQPEDVTESRWHQPWSEPVRFKAALLSGNQPFSSFFNPEPPVFETVDWFNWLSEPVKLPAGLKFYLQRPFTEDTANTLLPLTVPSWFNWLSEPVRQKPGLGAYLQKTFTQDTVFSPASATLLQGYNWWSEPVRQPIGLKSWLQQTIAWPPRLLPPVTFTVTIAATETNIDVAQFGIQVYNAITPVTTGTSANVSIAEVPTESNAAASLRES